jgi:hypothetical protein
VWWHTHVILAAEDVEAERLEFEAGQSKSKRPYSENNLKKKSKKDEVVMQVGLPSNPEP